MTAVYRSVFTAPEPRTYCFELHGEDDASLQIDGKTPQKTGFINNYHILEAEAGKTYDIEIRFSQEGDTAELLFDVGYLKNTDYAAVASSVSDADAIVYVGGLSSKLEGEEMSVRIDGFDRGDRTAIELPAVQKKMMQSLLSTGKPVVFVLMTGSAVGLEWENENIPAIINAWYGGQAGGTAVADVLFGDYNPSGKLPVTFYRSVDDLPDFENYDMKGRTYIYFEGNPVYPFGHGLTYTDFKFGKAEVIENEDGTKELAIKVKNVGQRAGEDVLQLYVSRPDDKDGPIKALKGFTRFSLKPGESTTVTIPFDEETFSIWNQETGRIEPVPGTFILHYGNTSDDACLKTLKYIL